MAKILVLGAGYVGARLAELARARGHDPVVLRRTPAKTDAQRVLTADLADLASLERVSERAELLVYCAGPDASTEEAYRLAYVVGLENALRVFGGAARRVLFVSSTAVYAQTDGGVVDEDSPAESRRFNARALLEAEALVSRAHPGAVVLRLGGIYGPGRASLLDAALSGNATYREGDEQFVNRFHRDDCAGALLHLLELERPERLYLGVDDEPCSRRGVLEWLTRELGMAPPRPGDHSETGHRGTSHKRCTNARLRASGYDLVFPTYREGYGALLRERPCEKP
ncbi:MAG: NAD-dependent epimerase/dehydratase family protein [Polyangiaceae bacterium]